MSKHNVVFVFDLDGTLISSKTSTTTYSIAYERTVKMLEERGIHLPENLRRHSENWIEAFGYKDFKELFDNNYLQIIQNTDFSLEKERIKEIFKYVKRLNATEIYVLTDNPFGEEILKQIGFEEIKVITVNKKKRTPTNMEEYFKEYIRVKSEELRKLSEKHENCEIIYVGDLPADEKIAEITNTRFIHINDLEKLLYEQNI